MSFEDHDSVKRWLDSTENYCRPLMCPFRVMTPSIDFYRYYDPTNDEDIKNTVISQQNTREWSYVEKYKTLGQFEKYNDSENDWMEANKANYKAKESELMQLKDVYIDPFSNRFQANYVFKKMVDFVDDFDLYYKCCYFSDGLIHEVNVPLFDVSCKSDWYRWCYLNTKRSKTSYSTMLGFVRPMSTYEDLWSYNELIKWYSSDDNDNYDDINKKDKIISNHMISCYSQLCMIERDLEVVYENLLGWIEELDILNRDISSFYNLMYKISPAYTMLSHNSKMLNFFSAESTE
jgi:hypothetical protein